MKVSKLLFAAVALATSAMAGQAPVQVYMLPLSVQTVSASYSNINVALATDRVFSVVSIVTVASNTVIYLDHLNDGYEADAANPTQASSKVFGDGVLTNGVAPGTTNDLLRAGAVVLLTSTVSVSQAATTASFIGGDKIAATKAVAVSYVAWAIPAGPVIAEGVDLYDTTRFGTNFFAPIGQNIQTNGGLFSTASLAAMPSQSGTTIQVDRDGNGSVDLVFTNVNAGSSVLVATGVLARARVQSSRPVQVVLLTGKINSTYASRWFALYPADAWTTEYFTPVGSPAKTNYPARAYLFNPLTNTLAIRYQTKAISGATNVPGSSVGVFQIPINSGARFFTTNGVAFQGILAIDASAGAADYDWGFNMIPRALLTPSAIVGYGAGSSDGTTNTGPVWVTAPTNTAVLVDYDGDPTTGPLTDALGRKYNAVFNVTPMDSVKIYNTNSANSQTGMRVYTTNGVSLAVAWGEDIDKAGTGNPNIDAGTSVQPLFALSAAKSAALTNDANGNGLFDPGDQIVYTIQINNDSFDAVTNVLVVDPLAPNTVYVTNSTTLNGSPVADNPAAGTAYPLDGAGYTIAKLSVGGMASITFRAAVTNPYPFTVPSIVNTARVTLGSMVFLRTVETPVRAAQAGISKTLVSPMGRPADVGEQIVFAIKVTNNGNIALASVPVTDTFSNSLLRFASATPGANATTTNTVSWTNLGALAMGGSTVITARFTAVSAGTGTNKATATPTATNGFAVAQVTAFASHSASASAGSAQIVKTLQSPAGRPAVVGEQLVFTLLVTNTGNVRLDAISVTDSFSTSLLSFASATPAPSSLAGAALTWTNVGALPAGGSTVITVRFTAAASGSGTNVAVASPTMTNGTLVVPSTSSVPHTTVNPSALSVAMLEDQAANIALFVNDLGGTDLTWAITAGPTNGTLTGTSSNWTYHPADNFFGNDSFLYVASNGTITSATGVVSISVIPVNDAPVGQGQSVMNVEDTATNITLTATDVDSATLVFAVVSGPTNGVLSGAAPNLVYTPRTDFNGADTFTFSVSDFAATSAPSVVQINVTPVNDAPVANPQSVAVPEDTPTPITLTATDPDDAILSFNVVDAPTNGALSGAAPNLTYTPNTNFNGTDSFTFSVSDLSAASASSVVQISITPVNDRPVAFAQSVTNNENASINITLAAFDVETNGLTFDLVISPSNGVVSGIGAALTYTPNSNYFGLDSFQFVVSDGSLTSAPAAVSIAVLVVNYGPTAAAGADQIIDLPLTNSVLLAGAAADDGIPGPLSNQWSKISGPGTVTFGSAMSLAATAAFSAPGTYVLRLTVSDGELSASDDVTVTVNEAPAINAGPDLIVTFPNGADLVGSATDDGLPGTNLLAVGWYQISGPGYALISNAGGATAHATFSKVGEYALRFSGSDSRLAGSDDMNVSVRPGGTNAPPQVNAGQDQMISGVSDATLVGTVSDDNLPYPPEVSIQWSVVSGPGAVTFTDAATLQTEVSFSTGGTYVLRLKAGDSLLTNSDDIVIIISYGNDAPEISAGPDISIFSPTGTLAAALADDGLPTGSVVTVQWSLVAGPGTVTFSNPSSAVTRVTMSTTGAYSLRVIASDGALSAADTVIVTRLVNQAPFVYAGNDSGIQYVACPVSLNGTVTDDGRPSTQALTHVWRQISGPGTATFNDPSRLDAQARFSAPGLYALELDASDSQLLASDTIEIRISSPCVAPAPPGLIAWWRGDQTALDSAGTNDGALVGGTTYAEEPLGQAFSFDGSDDTVRVPSNAVFNAISNSFTVEGWINPLSMTVTQKVMAFHDGVNMGMNLEVAPDDDRGLLLRGNVRRRSGATAADLLITSTTSAVPTGVFTHVAFTYNTTSGIAALYINGIVTTQANISAGFQARTDWNLYIGSANTSGFFKGQIDELSIFNHALQPYDVAGIYAAGRGGRCVAGSNQAPVVDAGPDLAASTGTVLTLQGRVTDDERPVGGGVVSTWSMLAGPGSVAFGDVNIPQTTAVFGQPGIYVLKLSANDGEKQASDAVVVRVDQPCGGQALPGPALWWPADGSAREAISGTNGILQNLTTYTQGMVGAGFRMKATGDGVLFPYYTNLNVGASTSGVSFEAWVKVDNLDADQPILEFFGQLIGVNARVKTDGTLLANLKWLNAGLSSDSIVQSMPGVFTTGVFHHVVFTHERSVTRDRLYFDGLPVAEVAPVITTDLRTDFELYLGYSPSLGRSLAGVLDEVSIYRRVLSQAEVYANYAAGGAGRCPVSGNETPTVYAGPDLSVAGTGTTATLPGFVHDDGLPSGSVLSTRWTLISGPGSAVFADQNSATSGVSFTQEGLYVLELTASDGAAMASDRMETRVGSSCVSSGASNRIAWWPLNSDTRDRVGSNDGYPLIGASYTTAQVGAGFKFSGTSNGIRVPASASLNVGTNLAGLSVDFWMRPDSLAATQAVFAYSSPDPLRPALLIDVNSTNGILHAVLGPQNGSSGVFPYDIYSSTGIVQTGVWQHVALVYSRTNSLLFLYKNGVGIKTQAVANFQTWTVFDVEMGYVTNSSSFRRFNGALDEVSVYNRPLTPAEVAALAGSPPIGACAQVQTNQPPVVDAGLALTAAVSTPLALQGFVTDDGLPSNIVNVTWSKISGPGTATFTNTATLLTAATFSQTGQYVLALAANDTVLSATDTVTIAIVPAQTNTAPFVYAGADILLSLGAPASLNGIVSDDGLPTGSIVSIQWSVISGPGTVAFANSTSAFTMASFTNAGSYALRLQASDSVLSSSDDITVNVKPFIVNHAPYVNAGQDKYVGLALTPTNFVVTTYPPPVVVPDRWIYDMALPGLTNITTPQMIYNNSMGVDGGNIYVGGGFNYGNGVTLYGLGQWDGCQWAPLYDPLLATNNWAAAGFIGRGQQYGVEAFQGKVYVSGGFMRNPNDPNPLGNGVVFNIWNGAHWTNMPSPRLTYGFIGVTDLEATTNGVYACGSDFSVIPNVVTNGYTNSQKIARFFGTNWYGLAGGITDTSTPPNQTITAGLLNCVKVASNGDVYVGGKFNMACSNGMARNIARFDGTNWLALGGGLTFDTATIPQVYAIAIASNGDVFAGGSFSRAGTNVVAEIARWDGANWFALGPGVPSAAVNAMTIWKGDLYVGASGPTVAGTNKYIASWDGAQWHALMRGTNNGVNAQVVSMVAADDGVYPSGDFLLAGGKAASHIAKWGQPRRLALRAPDSVYVYGTPTSGTNVSFAVEVSHPCGLGVFSVSFNADGGPVEYSIVATNTGSGALSLTFTNLYLPGTHYVTVTATDASGIPVVASVPVVVQSPARAELAVLALRASAL